MHLVNRQFSPPILRTSHPSKQEPSTLARLEQRLASLEQSLADSRAYRLARQKPAPKAAVDLSAQRQARAAANLKKLFNQVASGRVA